VFVLGALGCEALQNSCRGLSAPTIWAIAHNAKKPSNKAEFQTLPQKQRTVSKCAVNSALTQGAVLKLSSVG